MGAERHRAHAAVGEVANDGIGFVQLQVDQGQHGPATAKTVSDGARFAPQHWVEMGRLHRGFDPGAVQQVGGHHRHLRRSHSRRHRLRLGGSPDDVSPPGLLSELPGRSRSQPIVVAGEGDPGSVVSGQVVHPGRLECCGGKPHRLLEDLQRSSALLDERNLQEPVEGLLEPGLTGGERLV